MDLNNVNHLFGFFFSFFFFIPFVTYLVKKIQVEICQEWTKLFTSLGSKFISEGFYPCLQVHTSPFSIPFKLI